MIIITWPKNTKHNQLKYTAEQYAHISREGNKIAYIFLVICPGRSPLRRSPPECELCRKEHRIPQLNRVRNMCI